MVKTSSIIFFILHIISNNINLSGGLIMADKNYKIAQITQAEEKAIQKAEADVKAETGKDYVMIAWEKE